MFFEVSAKCGHVGRYKYIVKQFYIKTTSAKEAARIIRLVPRVKHNRKDAILSVTEIDYREYVAGVIRNNEDAYFNVYNSSDQKQLCLENIFEEEMVEPKRTRNVNFKLKKNKMYDNISRRMISGAVLNG